MLPRSKPAIGLSLMSQADFLAASKPLLAAGVVEVLEWSFDMGWGGVKLPPLVTHLLTEYSQAGQLLGHGVSYSLLSAERDSNHWLNCLAAECQDYCYRHISEHFGWMAAGRFTRSAPLPLPLLPETLQVGLDRLQRLADVAQVPVGLENLAFAFGMHDVEEQGIFLERLLVPIDGFLLLDLHNLYCQVHNFQQSAEVLLASYPLQRVREIHISGGSWSQHGDRQIRRDTHDDAVPTEVFELLWLALDRCPNLEAVILERIGNTLGFEDEQQGFQQDYYRMQRIVDEYWQHVASIRSDPHISKLIL
jgi:uncharacterized protein